LFNAPRGALCIVSDLIVFCTVINNRARQMAGVTVLGSKGLIGRRLLPLLRQAGISARSAGRAHSDAYFDWNDPNTFRSALDGSDTLYLVPPAMVASPAPLVDRLLQVAKSIGIGRVAAVSSLGVTFPTEPRASGRHEFEEVVTASGLEWSILRPSGFMQNFSEGFMLPAIKQAGLIASAAGRGKVAMVDTTDIASVAMAALTRDDLQRKALDITGSAAIEFAEMAAIISRTSGRSIAYRPVEEEQMAEMMHSAGVPKDYASILLRDQQAIREGHAAIVTTTVAEVTGRETKSFQQFAEESAHVWISS
jgi:uncharacterized protein YbjT (DUF2867 family)